MLGAAIVHTFSVAYKLCGYETCASTATRVRKHSADADANFADFADVEKNKFLYCNVFTFQQQQYYKIQVAFAVFCTCHIVKDWPLVPVYFKHYHRCCQCRCGRKMAKVCGCGRYLVDSKFQDPHISGGYCTVLSMEWKLCRTGCISLAVSAYRCQLLV